MFQNYCFEKFWKLLNQTWKFRILKPQNLPERRIKKVSSGTVKAPVCLAYKANKSVINRSNLFKSFQPE